MRPEDIKACLSLVSTNYNRALDENSMTLWSVLFQKLDGETFRRACMAHVAKSKFFPTASELLDAYQGIRNAAERARAEQYKAANQRALSAGASDCHLCGKSGICLYEKDGYDYTARCICLYGRDVALFTEAQMDLQCAPDNKDYYTVQQRAEINAHRNPFYRKTIQEALGDEFVLYDARKKERYLSRQPVELWDADTRRKFIESLLVS